MQRFLKFLRGHLHVIVIAPLLTILLTYPTIRYVFDRDLFWLPTRVYDIWSNLWNTWYFKLILAGEAAPLFTDLKFYPEGVSLAFLLSPVPHSLLSAALESLLPASNAYNLVYLLIILACVLSAYVYLLYLCRHRWVSLLGAVIFGCSLYVVTRPSQPVVAMIFFMPLTLHAFERALRGKRTWLAAAAGLWAGIAAFTGYYTTICLLIMLGLFILYQAWGRWRQRDFWLRVGLTLAVAGAFGFARAWPMLSDSRGLDEALTKGGEQEYGNDLLDNFARADHPLLTPLQSTLFGLGGEPSVNTSYLGYVPLLLIGIGLSRPRYRRKMAFWLYLLIPFLVLRLGSYLTINGQVFDSIALPKHLLEQLLPTVFGAFYTTEYFQAGALLPLAALSCYGTLTLLRAIRQRWRLPLIALLIAAVAFEYYRPLKPMTVPAAQVAFLDWLAAEDDQGVIRLINLPMGRVNAKLYDFYQTLNGYPHAEGIAGRTPKAAYGYIESDYLLGTWNAGNNLQCRIANQDLYLAALESLEADGFSHVIHHKSLWNAQVTADSFHFAEAAYEDDFAAIYRLADLRESCPDHLPRPELTSHLRVFLSQPDLRSQRNQLILSLHPPAALPERLFRFYAAEATAWKNFAHVSGGGGALQIQSANPAILTLDDLAFGSGIIRLVYNPRLTDPQSIPGFSEFLAARYRSCRRDHLAEEAVVEWLIARDFPCQLVDEERSLAARYDGDLELAESLTRVHDDELEILLWWSGVRQGRWAYSIQAFDERGDKVLQSAQDWVIGGDPLARIQLDTRDLAAGNYSVQLIVYDVENNQSLGGRILGSGQSFQRGLELARFPVHD